MKRTSKKTKPSPKANFEIYDPGEGPEISAANALSRMRSMEQHQVDLQLHSRRIFGRIHTCIYEGLTFARYKFGKDARLAVVFDCIEKLEKLGYRVKPENGFEEIMIIIYPIG